MHKYNFDGIKTCLIHIICGYQHYSAASCHMFDGTQPRYMDRDCSVTMLLRAGGVAKRQVECRFCISV